MGARAGQGRAGPLSRLTGELERAGSEMHSGRTFSKHTARGLDMQKGSLEGQTMDALWLYVEVYTLPDWALYPMYKRATGLELAWELKLDEGRMETAMMGDFVL